MRDLEFGKELIKKKNTFCKIFIVQLADPAEAKGPK